MPEYLAPGVYVEETSFRSKSIEGVSTTTTGFIGPCRYGPVIAPVDIVTSLGEFERTYAGGGKLKFAGEGEDPSITTETDNFLWHGGRAFFAEGGKRLYVSRIFRPLKGDYPPNFDLTPGQTENEEGLFYDDGHGRAKFGEFKVRSRFPGAASNVIVRFTAKASQNVLAFQTTTGAVVSSPLSPIEPTTTVKLKGVLDRDVIVLLRGTGTSEANGIYLAIYNPAATNEADRWELQPADSASPGPNLKLSELGSGEAAHVVTLTVNVLSDDREHDLGTWDNLPIDPYHTRAGSPDSLFDKFSPTPATVGDARSLPLVLSKPAPEDDLTGADILSALYPDLLILSAEQTARKITLAQKLSLGVTLEVQLTGGNDGLLPGPTEYEGKADLERVFKTGLKQFEDAEDISIVAAPGCTASYESEKEQSNASAILGLLINHAETMRYRIAVLDSPPDLSIADVRDVRAKLDSKYAAFYYPWVTVVDPVTRAELNLPPSGFVSGIYARNDIQRAVYKAPANEVVSLAIGFEQSLNKSQQEILNPEGINCFRFFEGRGFRLWGARTISSDPEWKYVNLRRYFAYLERSIDKGTQWAVFEPNGEALWANVRRTIEDFLLNEWQMGALLGEKPEKAYFVKCDRSTMTQNNLDNGQLVCLIGVAPLRPAEFVIFRIGQWTGDRKV
jgi:uncharacterized protein